MLTHKWDTTSGLKILLVLEYIVWIIKEFKEQTPISCKRTYVGIQYGTVLNTNGYIYTNAD